MFLDLCILHLLLPKVTHLASPSSANISTSLLNSMLIHSEILNKYLGKYVVLDKECVVSDAATVKLAWLIGIPETHT